MLVSALSPIFTSVGHRTKSTDLIDEGVLVPPQLYSCVYDAPYDDGKGDADDWRPPSALDDDDGCEHPLPAYEVIVDAWKRLAGDRKSIVFCRNIAEAEEMLDAFHSNGIKTTAVHSHLDEVEQKARIALFRNDEVQVHTHSLTHMHMHMHTHITQQRTLL